MKNKIQKLVLIIIVSSQMACSLLDESCPGAFYSGVDQDSGVLIEDEILSGPGSGPSATDGCYSFYDNPKIIAPNGKIYNVDYYGNFSESDAEEIVVLFPDLVFISVSSYYITATTNTDSLDYGNTTILTLTVIEVGSHAVLATKKIKLQIDPARQPPNSSSQTGWGS